MNWKLSKAGNESFPAYDSEKGEYRIVDCAKIRPTKPFRLISFIHEDQNGDFKIWDFPTLEEAKGYVDFI